MRMNRNKKMKKEKLQLIESQSYIYPITEDIIKKFKDHSLKLISDDKKYLLVYTQINLNELIDYYEWLFEQELFAKSSPSDMEYENLLEEADIKKPFNHDLYVSSFIKLDEKIEKIIYFHDSKMEIGSIVCNQKELLTGKALAKFVMVAASVENYGKSIKEVTPNGYFTFKLKGAK
jgi:hypothetical protein